MIVNWKWKKWIVYKLLRSNSLLPAVLTDKTVQWFGQPRMAQSRGWEQPIFSKSLPIDVVCYALPDSFPHRGHTVALTLWFSDTEHVFDKFSKCDGTFLHAYVHVSYPFVLCPHISFWHTFTHTHTRTDGTITYQWLGVRKCQIISVLQSSPLIGPRQI